METKSDFSTIALLKDDKRELLELRNLLFPNESLHGFMRHMVHFFRAGHCPMCKSVVGMTKTCSCKITNCPECGAPWDSEHNRCTANPEHCT